MEFPGIELGSLLKRQYDAFLQRAGSWSVYTRSDHRFRCQSCFNLSTNTSRADCEVCFGTGYHVTLERWLISTANVLRKTGMLVPPLLPAGWASDNAPVVFCRSSDVPVVGDKFFTVEWDKARSEVPGRGRPIRIIEALTVVQVSPMVAGEVIYYMAHCDIVTESQHRYETSLFRTSINTTRR